MDPLSFSPSPPLGITFLGSGSKGNAALLELGGRKFLLDAGLSSRRIEKFLKSRDLGLGDLEGVIITHGHGDHINGLSTLLNRHPMPVYCTHGTSKELNYFDILPKELILLRQNQEFELAGTRIWPFPVPHDAMETIGLRFEASGITMCVATDLGHITPEIMQYLTDTDILCLESNYDEQMLIKCRYPPWLKTRIKGPFGHLPNIGVRGVLSRQKRPLRHLALVHLSEESNTPELVRENLQPLLGLPQLKSTIITVASQNEPSPAIFGIPEPKRHYHCEA